MKKYLAIFLLGSLSPVWSQETIVRIHFSSLIRTQPNYLKKFVQSEADATLDSVQIQKDMQNLKNLQMFSDVSYSVRDTIGGKIVNFDCQELVTLLPVGNFGGITNNFWFQFGVNDFN